jgi:hypothetical protein
MKKSIFLLAVILIILSFSVNLPAATDCSKTTDASIVKMIKRKLTRDLRIRSQINQIRISSKNKVVTISGIVKGTGVKAAITKYISGIYCVDQLINKLNGVTVKACTKCQYLCNGACIDKCLNCERKLKPKKDVECPVCPGNGGIR